MDARDNVVVIFQVGIVVCNNMVSKSYRIVHKAKGVKMTANSLTTERNYPHIDVWIYKIESLSTRYSLK